MKWLLLGQLAVPVALAAWMLLRPAGSALGVVSQAVGSLLALALLARVGLWLFPPWWTPVAAAVVVAIGVWRSRPWTVTWPRGPLAWAGAALFGALGAGSAIVLAQMLAAARLPLGEEPISLAFPLAAGRYLVVNGGASITINAHRESMDSTIVRLRPWRGNGHAVDLVAIDGLGLRAHGLLPADPASYRIFGADVLAPCAGTIVVAEDGLPDMIVPLYDRSHLAGNHVVVDCAGVHVVLAHFREGSVRVRVGESVEAGAVLASSGNSGGTSEPHLHVHAQRPGPLEAPMAGDPIPMLLDGRYLVRGDRISPR